jgi:nucleotide-binding universal stress UspA family protein
VEVIQVAVPVVTGLMGDGVILMPPEDPMPYLTGVVERLQAQGIQASAVALNGPPAPELLRHLEASRTSLLSMTTHGRSGLSRFLLGSVAEAVVRKAPCPVLLHRIAAAKKPTEEPAAKGVKIY